MMIRDGDQEGQFVKLYAPVTLYNGYTMVPIRAVTETFGADVTWNGVSRTVNILTDKKLNRQVTQVTTLQKIIQNI